MKTLLFALLLALSFGGIATAAPATSCTVSVNHDPLVMRIGKDEFRIAFGVGSDHCSTGDCRGVIRYTAEWTTDDGASRSDNRLLDFTVPRGARGSIAVDRSYFDTSEGEHTTDIVKVNVDAVSCERAIAQR